MYLFLKNVNSAATDGGTNIFQKYSELMAFNVPAVCDGLSALGMLRISRADKQCRSNGGGMKRSEMT
jgi:hypothetical protein